MDLAPVYMFGRPAVQPSVANRDTLGLRPVTDPREAQIPAAPLAARNAADLRQANGPRQSSSSGETRNDEEHSALRVRGRATSSHSRQSLEEGEEERGGSVDVTV